VTTAAPARRWEVQTYTICGGWVNCWREGSRGEELTYFDSPEEAEREIDELLEDVKAEVAAGHMTDEYDREDYRVVEVNV
jgi:hypothetical protein